MIILSCHTHPNNTKAPYPRLFITAFSGAVSFPWTYARYLFDQDTRNIFPLNSFLDNFFRASSLPLTHIACYVLMFYIVLQSWMQVMIYIVVGLVFTFVMIFGMIMLGFVLTTFATQTGLHISFLSAWSNIQLTCIFFVLCNMLAIIVGYAEATLIPTVYWGYLGICSNCIWLPHEPYIGIFGRYQNKIVFTRYPSPVFIIPWLLCWMTILGAFAYPYLFQVHLGSTAHAALQ